MHQLRTRTPLTVFTELCPLVNCPPPRPSVDPTVQVCNSEMLGDTLAKLGTIIMHYQTIETELVQ